MDYKLTFEDGSEALTHYGIKGMKWGKHKARQMPFDVSSQIGYVKSNSELERNLLADKAQKMGALDYKLKYGTTDRIFGTKLTQFTARYVSAVAKEAKKGRSVVNRVLTRSKNRINYQRNKGFSTSSGNRF